MAARITGMKWNESLQLGALMNTRGLMELIALNIGYDLGILSPAIFTMLVIMALVTTFMTGPLLTLLTRKSADGRRLAEPIRRSNRQPPPRRPSSQAGSARAISVSVVCGRPVELDVQTQLVGRVCITGSLRRT